MVEYFSGIPVLQALILADDIYVDRDTGKKVIAGTFNKLWTDGFPSTFGRQTKAYVNLTNCRGELDFQLKWIDLKDESILMASPEISLNAADPLTSYELIIEVPPFSLPHAGQYAFEFYCNAQRLGALRVGVDETRQKEE